MGNGKIRCFLSYHRDDNQNFPGVVDRLLLELVGQLKADAQVDVEIFHDVQAMVGGENWRDRIHEVLADSVVFIPVVTAAWFASDVCMEELNAFRINTPRDEVNSAIIPLVLAGHNLLRPDARQEEVRFIESLNYRDLRQPYLEGYASPDWRKMVSKVVTDVLAWHDGYGARREAIEYQEQTKANGIGLDDNFLKDVGLSDLPASQAAILLQQVYSNLETRTGQRLTENMSDELLEEFGAFVDMDESGMKAWFDEHLPAYDQTEAYKALRKANPEAPEVAVMAEYGAMMWLGINRPDYPDIVREVLSELQSELQANPAALVEKLKVQENFFKALQRTASAFNETAPVMIDSETSLDCMLALPGNILMYMYTLINVTRSELDAKEIADAREGMTAALLDNIRYSSDMKEMRENGVTFKYVYRASDGGEVINLTFTPDLYLQDL